MALDLTKAAQVSKAINDAVYAANAVMTLKLALDQFDSEQSVNNWAASLGAGGATYPAGFSTTPTQLNDCRFALATLKGALATSLGSTQASLDALRLSMGVLTGTG